MKKDNINFSRRKFLKTISIFSAFFASNKVFSMFNFFNKNVSTTNPTIDIDKKQPFYDIHQPGVVTPQQPYIMLVSFDILGTNKEDLKRLFIILTKRIAFLSQGGTIPQDFNPKMPPKDSGILGKIIYPNNLTITVAVGASLFDNRFNLSHLKPLKLKKMTRFPNDALDANLCHGDILLQLCANENDTIIHALRDIIKHTPDLLSIRWFREGFISARSAYSNGKITPINLLGFKDGTANPNIHDHKLMNRIVWVNKNLKEPAWTYGGTYQVVRIIKFRLEFWDRTPLQEQERIFGREKYSGAPLGMKSEHDIPNYNHFSSNKIPIDAHIRLANPRNIQSQDSLILRRGYNYSYGLSNARQLDMGLLFICFQCDLEKGFLNIQKRLNGETLEEYIKPIGGGYFFVMPGIKKKEYIGQKLLEMK